MNRHIDLHLNRRAYCIVGEGCISEPANMFNLDSPMRFLTSSPLKPIEDVKPKGSALKFGRLFEKATDLKEEERLEKIAILMRLGDLINNLPNSSNSNDSNIPSGYTYLGQFIAHEVTFDNNLDIPDFEYEPQTWRSPQLDLDTLYGQGPTSVSRNLYDEKSPARLRIGKTLGPERFNKEFENDLPRKTGGEAQIADERNDENLAVAQVHVAFIRFHNFIVERLSKTECPSDQLFTHARKIVQRCFQRIVVSDFLPRVLDSKVVEEVSSQGYQFRLFRVEKAEDLFMPLEFSAAAFRFGHSMIRQFYEWNYFFSHESSSSLDVSNLFTLTHFSGEIGLKPKMRRLPSDWIIDWRRFFDLTSLGYDKPTTGLNIASRLDRIVNIHLEKITTFNHHGLPTEKHPLPIRNLLRGFALRLPSGEVAAKHCGETPLNIDELASGPCAEFKELLSHPLLKDQTPLWYYVVKEAELNYGKYLGRVGSRIVAETLLGLIKNSEGSIIQEPDWVDEYNILPELPPEDFKMIHLLHFADVVDPIGKHRKSLYKE